jgi:trk system potassium uptake protein TrkH
MGIIVLAIAILPYLGIGGMQLFKAEVPGLAPERLRPRITQTAKLLWFVYLGLTATQVALYMLGGMGGFEAINHAFSTLATGGFSTRNASMAAFDSRYIQYVTIVFMYLAGINFSLHFRAAAGRPVYWKDTELRLYTLIILVAAVVLGGMSLSGASVPLDWTTAEQAVRDGLFTAASIVTTTGFITADYELWIPAAQFLVFALMFTGGMAGSTGGGVKIVRVLLILENAWIEVRRHLHPRAILLARVGKRVVREDVLFNVLGFVILYITLFGAGAFVMTLFGMDLETALGASAATVGNIGPGLGAVGATDNYASIPGGAQVVLTFLMLVGRLEIYTVLLLFHPETWANRSAVDKKTKGRQISAG